MIKRKRVKRIPRMEENYEKWYNKRWGKIILRKKSISEGRAREKK